MDLEQNGKLSVAAGSYKYLHVERLYPPPFKGVIIIVTIVPAAILGAFSQAEKRLGWPLGRE